MSWAALLKRSAFRQLVNELRTAQARFELLHLEHQQLQTTADALARQNEALKQEVAILHGRLAQGLSA